MSFRRHGLASLLKSAKRWRASDSAITAFLKHGPYPFSKVSTSEHIKRFCFRALRGKVGATYEDWNSLALRLYARMGSHWKVREATTYEYQGLIRAWSIGLWKGEPDCSNERSEQEKLMLLAEAKKSVARATITTLFIYSDINSRVECEVCGIKVGETKNCERSYRNYQFSNGWTVCKNSRCRAVAYLFKKRTGSRKNPRHPISVIIEEVSKNAGNNENFRRVAKHFVRYA